MRHTTADPFRLFPRAIRLMQIVKPAAPGLQETVVASNVRAISKNATSIDLNGDYVSRDTTRSIHVKPEDLPQSLRADPEQLVGFLLVSPENRRYVIKEASRGDDMEAGVLPFIHIQAQPYGR